MTAQIINLRAWRLAHSEPAAMFDALEMEEAAA